MKQSSLFEDIIIDNFAGGGGASTGIELATGRSVDIAINHDPAAIAMHKANHPNTEHYQDSVWNVDPIKAVRGRPVGLAWFSPDCKHFSKAKGGKPRDKNIRGLAWVTVKWAIAVRPRTIMLENVEEFKTWGPLDEDGNPIKERQGETFKAFVDCLSTGLKDETHPAWDEIETSLGNNFSKEILMNGLGYKVESKELRACDYGAPTIRRRFFLIARCDGRAICWPTPTHGDPNSNVVKAGVLEPWHTAAEIIDWSIPCPSIFDRKKELCENTLRRIAKGVQKFVVDNPKPFIVQVNHSKAKHHYCSDIESPLSTITSKHGFGVVTPFLTSYHSETQPGEVRGLSLNNPIHTLDTSNRFGLVTAYISQQFKNSTGQSLEAPLWTIPTVNKANLVTAFLVKYYGADIGQSLNEPLHTVTSKDRFGLVTIKGQEYQIVDIGLRMLQPHELFKAQGFPANYIIDRDYLGNPYPNTAQVARCGNAVPPPFAEALVRANLPELCDSEDTGRYARVV